MSEVAALTDLQLGNREFNQRRQRIIERLGWGRQITSIQVHEFGTLRGAAWLRNQVNPAGLVADTVSRLRGLYAIGRTTQDKKTPQIEKLSRQVDEELWAAENALRLICQAEEFFDPTHLSHLSGWLNAQRGVSCAAVASGQKIQLNEAGHQTIAVAWSGGRPAFDFLELRRPS